MVADEFMRFDFSFPFFLFFVFCRAIGGVWEVRIVAGEVGFG